MNCVGHNGHTIEKKAKEKFAYRENKIYEESNFNILFRLILIRVIMVFI
ncbi:hypothetical protein CU025_2598 [Enterococcus faecium]|nr:hypothetical protein Nizo1839_0908 [Lactiplantibacillus plantarum]MBK4768030.1 hypothetical protein [Enterococcus faecium]